MKNGKRFPIYNRYLKIRYNQPITVVMACLMPFLQAFLGAVLQVTIINNNMGALSLSAMFYWSMFALNGKRIALGKWKAIVTFIIFASLGTLVGVYMTNNYFK